MVILFTLVSLFWKNNLGLWDHVAVCASPVSLLDNGSVKIPFPLLGNGSVKNLPIVASKRLGKNPPIVSRQRLGKNPPIVARQRLRKNPPIVRQKLGRNVNAVTNTHAIIE
jgi:hypothetical protein